MDDLKLLLTEVRDHIPLEQGLRLIMFFESFFNGSCEVRDHIPLEQGLRLQMKLLSVIRLLSQRPYSIRTRIKTLIGI